MSYGLQSHQLLKKFSVYTKLFFFFKPGTLLMCQHQTNWVFLIVTRDIPLCLKNISKLKTPSNTNTKTVSYHLLHFDVDYWWPGWGGTVPPHPGHQQAASSVLYTTSCKHSLVLLRMDEINARNMLSCLKLLKKIYCCIYYLYSFTVHFLMYIRFLLTYALLLWLKYYTNSHLLLHKWLFV